MYVIYEKSYIDRPTGLIPNETNIGDSNSVDGIVDILKIKRNINISKRTIYRSIKEKSIINDKYYIYKIKIEK